MAEEPMAVVNPVTPAGIPKRLTYKPRTPSQPSGILLPLAPFPSPSRRQPIMVQFNADVVAAAAAALNFTQVALTPPLDWIAGGSLFPSQIIAGYNAPLDEYTAEEWSAHILDACKGYEACTSADGFQGMFNINYLGALRKIHRHSSMLTVSISNEQWQHGWAILVWLCLPGRCHGRIILRP